MINEKIRLRPMRVGEVATVAGDPRETIRTRIKQGVFGFEKATGWKRFTDFETVVICVHSRLMRATKDADLAQIGSLLAGKSLIDEWLTEDDGTVYFRQSTFTKERYMIFWRSAEDQWQGEISVTPEHLQQLTDKRFSESYSDSPCFTVVNLKTILSQTLLAIMELQVASENGGNK